MTNFAERFQVLFDSISPRADVLFAKLALLRNEADADILADSYIGHALALSRSLEVVRSRLVESCVFLQRHQFPENLNQEDQEQFTNEFELAIDSCLGPVEQMTEYVEKIAEHPKMRRESDALFRRADELEHRAADQHAQFAIEVALQIARPRLTSDWETNGGPGQIAAKATSMIQAASRCRTQAFNIEREMDRDSHQFRIYDEIRDEEFDWTDMF